MLGVNGEPVEQKIYGFLKQTMPKTIHVAENRMLQQHFILNVLLLFPTLL